MVAEIASEHARGRRLLVGTTDLDADRPVVWDIGAIAASDAPERRELIRDILVASSSIPATLPARQDRCGGRRQRYDEMHVDGGIANQAFLFPANFTPARTSTSGRTTRGGAPSTSSATARSTPEYARRQVRAPSRRGDGPSAADQDPGHRRPLPDARHRPRGWASTSTPSGFPRASARRNRSPSTATTCGRSLRSAARWRRTASRGRNDRRNSSCEPGARRHPGHRAGQVLDRRPGVGSRHHQLKLASAAMRSSGTCRSMLRAAAPSGNAAGSRSSGTSRASTARAAGPLNAMASPAVRLVRHRREPAEPVRHLGRLVPPPATAPCRPRRRCPPPVPARSVPRRSAPRAPPNTASRRPANGAIDAARTWPAAPPAPRRPAPAAAPPPRMARLRRAQPRSRSPSGSKKTGGTISQGSSSPRSRQTARTALAHPRPPVPHEAERDVVAERRRMAVRGEVAQVVRRLERRALVEHMRPGQRAARPSPSGLQPHQLLPLRPRQPRPRRARLADAVLAPRDHPPEPEVVRRRPPVQLGVGQKPLLDPEHVQRLEPVGPAAERPRLLDQAASRAPPRSAPAPPPRRPARPRRRCGRAAPPPRATATAPQAMNGKPALSIGAASSRFSSSRDRGPATATCAHCSVTETACDVELRPEALQAELQVRHHLPGRRGGGGEEEVRLAAAAPRCRRP